MRTKSIRKEDLQPDSISLAVLGLPQLVFAAFNARNDGRQPVASLYTPTQGDLAVAGVVLVALHRGKDFYRRAAPVGFDIYASPVATGTVGNHPHSARSIVKREQSVWAHPFQWQR